MSIVATTIKEEPVQHKLNSGFAWLVWGLAAIFYFSDYMARVAPSVMHLFLQISFGINEAGFGVLMASFYIPYVAMQIPVGLIVDRISIRLILTVMSIITAIGCVVFGMAHGLLGAAFGRMLIGLSASFAFVCALRLATSWFPGSKLGLLAGLTQALGMLGAAAGAVPVSFLVATIGWRNSMFAVGTLFVVLSTFLYQYIQDSPKSKTKSPLLKGTHELTIPQSLKIIIFSKQTWLNALYAGFLFAPTAVIGESIGAAYLQFGRNLSAHAAALAISLIFIGWGIGGPLSGLISDKIGKRKPIMIGSALCGMLLSSLLIFTPHLNQQTAFILFFLFGMTNTGVAIAYAVSTELHASNVKGTAIGFTNMASILIGASLQPAVGWLIDFFAGERSFQVSNLVLTDFQFGLKILPLCSLMALLLAFCVKETYCKPQKPDDIM